MNLPALKNSIESIGEALEADERYEGQTLFLRGAKSKYIEDTDFDLIRKHFPKSKVITVPKAGHWLHAENPEFFTKK